MRTVVGLLAGAAVLLGSLVTLAPATMLADATLCSGSITVSGSKGARLAALMWEGTMIAQTNKGGAFSFTTAIVPQDCVGTLSDGVSMIDVAIIGCTVAQPPRTIEFPATDETTCWDNSKIDCVAQ